MIAICKTGVLFILIMIFAISNVSAQVKIEVKDVSQLTSKGTQTGYSVFIKDATLENVIKKWGHNMKKEKAADIFKSKDDKVKYEVNAGEYIAERAILPEISNKYITTIANITNVSGGVQLTAFFELDSMFISKQTLGTTYNDTRNYVRNFGISCYKDAVAYELEREDKKLIDLNDKLESFKTKKIQLEKSIIKSESLISEMESELRTNLSDQERSGRNLKMLNDSLSHQQVNSPAYTVYNSRLKEESKTQKRLLNDNAAIHKKIENSKKDILEYKEALSKNLVDQEYQTKQIENQKLVVVNVKIKIQNIK